MNGVLVVDKPAGMTSHDVVNRVRRMLGQRSVGHLGTLDPSATGVLPLVVGSFTRLAKFYTHCEKGYEGEIRFGFATDTYDADGEATTAAQEVRLERGQIEALAESFLGTVEQMPPPFSAKKIGGVPAYKLARKQREVALKAVPVEIKEFTILEVEGDWVTFRARVGSGTYMRSIAHDMGQKIGCGAHLARLGRTAVAEFGLAEALGLEAVDLAVAFIRAGRAVNLPEMSRAPLVKVFYGQRELVAIATRIAGTLFHAGMVLGNREVEEARDSTRRFGRDW